MAITYGHIKSIEEFVFWNAHVSISSSSTGGTTFVNMSLHVNNKLKVSALHPGLLSHCLLVIQCDAPPRWHS